MSRLLIDGNNVLMASLRNVAFDDNSPAYWFLIQVRKQMTIVGATSVVVAWDHGRSWRRELSPEYKGHRRTTTPTELQEKTYNAINTARDLIQNRLLPLLGVEQIYCSGYEADDLAGHFAKIWLDKPLILYSNDKDWLMLVDENTSILYKDRGLKKHIVVNEDNFYTTTTWGNPTKFLLAKCAMGDPSDNIKGLKGIGPKTIQKYMDGSLDAKKTKVLDEFYDSSDLFLLNLKLMDIRAAEVEKPVSIIRSKCDPKKLEMLLNELTFTSLLKNMKDWLPLFEKLETIDYGKNNPD